MSVALTGRVALVTHAGLPQLSDDDRLLLPELTRLGIEGVPVDWSNGEADWKAFDAVVLRSCWDYHLRAEEFLVWVNRLEGASVRLWNSPRVIRWNVEKGYLLALEQSGIPVVPTRWVGPGSAPPLPALLGETGWDRVVIKPSISASAHNTWRSSHREAVADDTRFQEMVRRQRTMVQPYIQEVESRGEWSLFYFGGNYSHAVVKRPKPGDFRVQHELGGVYERREPDALLIDQGRRALQAAPDQCLYGRVDGFEIEDRFVLLELELLEPSMALAYDPGAPGRFARAIRAVIG